LSFGFIVGAPDGVGGEIGGGDGGVEGEEEVPFLFCFFQIYFSFF